MNIMFFLKPKSELAYIYDYHTLRQAMEIMEYHKYSCVPILNKEGKYVGSITEGDVLWALKKLDIFNIKEAEDISIMKIKRRVDYQCVTAESDMEDLIGRAMEQNFVPVIDDQEHFIGIITRRDIIGYCSGIFGASPFADGTYTGLCNSMGKGAVDISIALPAVTKVSQVASINRFASAYTEGPVISFGGIHPECENYKEILKET